jgi:hypothetical protein
MPLRISKVLPITVTEPISLAEAKTWLQIDFSDFDDLIQDKLIPSARIQSEKQSGQSYFEVEVVISENSRDERIYPIGPWIEDVTTDEYEIVNYSYLAGFNTANPLPIDLKVAMLNRIATEFAFRQNQLTENIYKNELSSSLVIENRYRNDLMI